MQIVTFNVTVVNNDDAAIKTRKGVANNVLEESVTAINLLLTNIQAGICLSDVALFVDSNSNALAPKAQTRGWESSKWRGL